MKILYVGPYYFNPVNDTDTVYYIFRDFIEAIQDEFEAVYLLTGKSNSNYAKVVEEKYDIKLITPNAMGHRRFSRISYILAGIKAVKRHQIDVVTSSFGGISYGFDACVIAKATKIRSVVRVAGNEIKTRLLNRIYGGMKGKVVFIIDILRQWLALNLSDAVIGMSPWEVNRIKRIVFNKVRVHHCPRGVDTDAFRPLKKKEYKKDSFFKALYIGRQSREKGFDLVIKTARLLEDYERIKFVFAGDFEKKEEANRNFIGYIHPSNLQELYEDNSIVILSSRTEGFPQVIAEAMAMEKPCIVSRHLFEEYFEDGKDVLLCELNPNDIADKILYLYKNPGIAKEIGKNAREFILKHLDKRIWGQVYRDILLNRTVKGE